MTVFGVAVLIAGATYAVLSLTQDHSEEERLAENWVTYVNAKGQEWSIPEGSYEFTVSSEEGSYPRFTSGTIDPLDVKVGDIQKMRVTIVSPMPLAAVVAEIETDTTNETVQLELAGQKPVTVSEARKNPYVVAENGALSLAANEIATNLSIKTAQAQALVEYTYIGQWTVRDTHTETYHTTFTVSDTTQKSDSMTLAWSDPVCVFANGVLQASCTVSSGVEGIDNRAMTFNSSFSVVLNGGSVFAFNPGQKITIANGGKFIFGGGKIQQFYLCQNDSDVDGYPNGSIAYVTSTSASCSGAYKRLYTMTTTTLDCDPYNGNVYQGQTGFFTTRIVDSGGASTYNDTFDYNCNGSSGLFGGKSATPSTYPTLNSESQYTVNFGSQSVSHAPTDSACVWDGDCSANTLDVPVYGWVDSTSIPICAFSGTYISSGITCSLYNNQTACEAAGRGTMVQGCR